MYTASRYATQVIVSAIKQACSFQISVHDDMVFAAWKAYQQLLDRTHNDSFSLISSSFDQTHQRVLQRAKDNDLAVWLSVTPVENNHKQSIRKIRNQSINNQYEKSTFEN